MFFLEDRCVRCRFFQHLKDDSNKGWCHEAARKLQMKQDLFIPEADIWGCPSFSSLIGYEQIESETHKPDTQTCTFQPENPDDDGA